MNLNSEARAAQTKAIKGNQPGPLYVTQETYKLGEELIHAKHDVFLLAIARQRELDTYTPFFSSVFTPATLSVTVYTMNAFLSTPLSGGASSYRSLLSQVVRWLEAGSSFECPLAFA